MEYKHLFSPLEIRGHKYRNRISFGPTLFAHAVISCPEIRENVYRMVEDRARGGAAEVTTGEICCNFEESPALFIDHAIDFTLYEGSDFEYLKEYALRIKRHGAVALLEFCHEGYNAPCRAPYSPWGPEAMTRPDGMEVKAMDEAMMEKVCGDFERIGRYAMAAGFDGCLLHGAHGFLIQQFVSPRTNHRTDEYGGSAENRARFPLRLLEALRRGVGENGIIEMRFSAQDGVPGGMTIEDTVEFARLADGYVDIFHVSNGLKEKGNSTGTFSSHYDIHGVNVEYARAVKQVMKKSYVAVIGGLNDPDQCEEIIASGAADLVVLGRQGFADPEFANKAMQGQSDRIRRCLRCFACYPTSMEHPTDIPLRQRGFTPEQLKEVRLPFQPSEMGWCSVNPDSGFARTPFDCLPKCEASRRVLIVGGGPAGMQAAITAAKRGHKVTLVEKETRLGGTVRRYAQADGDKKDILNLIDLLETEAGESAEIRTGLAVTPEYLRSAEADVLILATGARAKNPALPGIEYAREILEAYQDAPAGKNVVIVGAGLSACETAVFLAKRGNRVTMVLRGSMLARECIGGARNSLMTQIEKLGIETRMGVSIQGFDRGAVLTDGAPIPGDVIYAAFGSTPDPETEALKAAWGDRPVFTVGDCMKPSQVGSAIHGGYDAAVAIR